MSYRVLVPLPVSCSRGCRTPVRLSRPARGSSHAPIADGWVADRGCRECQTCASHRSRPRIAFVTGTVEVWEAAGDCQGRPTLPLAWLSTLRRAQLRRQAWVVVLGWVVAPTLQQQHPATHVGQHVAVNTPLVTLCTRRRQPRAMDLRPSLACTMRAPSLGWACALWRSSQAEWPR